MSAEESRLNALVDRHVAPTLSEMGFQRSKRAFVLLNDDVAKSVRVRLSEGCPQIVVGVGLLSLRDFMRSGPRDVGLESAVDNVPVHVLLRLPERVSATWNAATLLSDEGVERAAPRVGRALAGAVEFFKEHRTLRDVLKRLEGTRHASPAGTQPYVRSAALHRLGRVEDAAGVMRRVMGAGDEFEKSQASCWLQFLERCEDGTGAADILGTSAGPGVMRLRPDGPWIGYCRRHEAEVAVRVELSDRPLGEVTMLPERWPGVMFEGSIDTKLRRQLNFGVDDARRAAEQRVPEGRQFVATFLDCRGQREGIRGAARGAVCNALALGGQA